MTRESAKKNLEFITAFANGETIQYLGCGGEWYDTDDPMFYEDRVYRIKPKRVFTLYHLKHNKFKTNLANFTEFEIDYLLSEGWVKVELVKCND